MVGGQNFLQLVVRRKFNSKNPLLGSPVWARPVRRKPSHTPRGTIHINDGRRLLLGWLFNILKTRKLSFPTEGAGPQGQCKREHSHFNQPVPSQPSYLGLVFICAARHQGRIKPYLERDAV